MRSQLKKSLEKRGYSYKEISEQTGLSAGVISKVLASDKAVKFNIIIKLIRCLSPENEKELIYKYCKNEEKKPENLKDLLEYLMTHREFDLLEDVITECKSHKNKELNQWGNYYDVLKNHKKEIISTEDILEYINNTNVTCKSLFVLTRLLELNAYYKMMSHNIISNKILSAIKLVEDMEEGYLKHSFTARVSEMVSANELKVNKDVVKARKYALNVIESKIGDFFTGFSYYTVAVSYMYEDVLKMKKYFSLSLDIFKKCYTDKNFETIQLEIRKIINIIDNDFSSSVCKDSEDPIDMFILGKIKNDTSYLFACLTEFVKSGNLFLAELPKKELLLRGINEKLLCKMAS